VLGVRRHLASFSVEIDSERDAQKKEYLVYNVPVIGNAKTTITLCQQQPSCLRRIWAYETSFLFVILSWDELG
jgi:hypothetical protein